MKHIVTMGLTLTFAIAGAYAQQITAKMTLSGTAAPSTVDLGTGTPASEYNLAGNGTLGSFTLRTLSASTPAPGQSSTCSGANQLYASVVAGTGVFRFQDGSLLKVNLTDGSDCIDFAAQQALCIRIFKITGGTGRFKDASGKDVTLTMTVVPVSADASGNPVFFAITGDFTGTVSGVAMEEQSQDARR